MHLLRYKAHWLGSQLGGAELGCVLQGIRRIVAVTGEEAAAAIKEGEGLAHQLAAAQKLQGQQLETEVAALKQVSVIQL